MIDEGAVDLAQHDDRRHVLDARRGLAGVPDRASRRDRCGDRAGHFLDDGLRVRARVAAVGPGVEGEAHGVRQPGQPAGHRLALRRRQWHRHRIPDGRGRSRPSRADGVRSRRAHRIESGPRAQGVAPGRFVDCLWRVARRRARAAPGRGSPRRAGVARRPRRRRRARRRGRPAGAGAPRHRRARGDPPPARRVRSATRPPRLAGRRWSPPWPSPPRRRRAATIPLPFDEDLWTRVIFRRHGDAGGPRRGDPDHGRRARGSTTAPPASTTRPAPGSAPARIACSASAPRPAPSPPSARACACAASAWRRRADRPPIRCGRRWSAPRRPTPTRSSTSCSRRAPAGSPGSTTPSAGSTPGCSGTCSTGDGALDRLRRLADVFTRVNPEWRIEDRPLWRPLVDPATLLLELEARAGRLADPARAGGVGRHVRPPEQVDAAWLVDRVFSGDGVGAPRSLRSGAVRDALDARRPRAGVPRRARSLRRRAGAGADARADRRPRQRRGRAAARAAAAPRRARGCAGDAPAAGVAGADRAAGARRQLRCGDRRRAAGGAGRSRRGRRRRARRVGLARAAPWRRPARRWPRRTRWTAQLAAALSGSAAGRCPSASNGKGSATSSIARRPPGPGSSACTRRRAGRRSTPRSPIRRRWPTRWSR